MSRKFQCSHEKVIIIFLSQHCCGVVPITKKKTLLIVNVMNIGGFDWKSKYIGNWDDIFGGHGTPFSTIIEVIL